VIEALILLPDESSPAVGRSVGIICCCSGHWFHCNLVAGPQPGSWTEYCRRVRKLCWVSCWRLSTAGRCGR
jgi:hypothetical protein